MAEHPAEPAALVLVGCGAISRAYLSALERVPGLRLAAAVDRDEGARRTVAEANGVPAFADVGQLLAHGPRCLAALVLTPPDTHEALTTQLLEAGLHVLCEKPLAPTVAAAQRMLSVARSRDRRLMLGSKFRYTADVQKAHELLQQGLCGDVVLYENVFCAFVAMTGRWNADPAHSGGGVLIDNGCHSVDVARYLLGPIARVQAQFGRRVQDVPVEDTARLLFTSRSGALGVVDLSWSLFKETSAYVRLHGNEGTIEIGWQQSRYKRRGEADWTVFGRGYDKIAAFAAQLEDFARAVAGGGHPVIDDEDALASVSVIDCAYRSAEAERWLDVPSP
ncbi:MAG: Gfo/Idh/MocA family oxidoreductase [Planctomycetes bacterium]|nr:Gfo/Idh/MocA family oxidoreductase [Planctomycetota bacterium]MCB9885284.1 Gfo/Idh/MocA family oxidoreductase [Planctomycetota bacterium]